LKEIRQFVTYFREMISYNCRSIFVVNSFLKFEQFENGKQNKSEQQKKFHTDKSPKQECSSNWLKPKKIFYKKGKQEIQQSQTNKENHSPNQFIGIILLDEKFKLLINEI
jgi:hypothetical protein